ncbi:MAG: HAAS signaling domain-containing protein [Anaerobacillus sp.]|uniref:HAAS signaling domain-containing protein n=1 Tax=Anaerobacillus sp. TaxID=1872506 RepID=UPI00391C76CC
MIQSKHDYLIMLEKQLKNVDNRAELLQEFEVHISEMLEEIKSSDELNEAAAMAKIVERLGSPEQIATTYIQELEVTPTKIQWTFIAANLLFFIGGVCLTILYNQIPSLIIAELWTVLTSITSVLIILYMFFWVLLGYEIGKEFGVGGKELLRKTFYIALAPNLLLMALVVFRIMPFQWFDPLLTPSFIAVCILCTIFLYPISYAGFRWGTIRSV